MDLKFHPLADDYDLLEGDDFEELCQSIQENGLDEDGIIVLYEGMILDGRNRYRACRKAGVEPRFRNYDPERDGAEPAEFVRRRNDPRRHDPLTIRQRRRKARIERIAEARGRGESLRTIAERENVSEKQVREDIKDGPKVEPPSGRIIGLDGKSHPAKKAHAAGPTTEQDETSEDRYYRPHYDHQEGVISVGRMKVKLVDLLAILANTPHPDRPPPSDLPAEYVTIKVRLTRDEEARFQRLCRDQESPAWEVIRNAMRSFGLI